MRYTKCLYLLILLSLTELKAQKSNELGVWAGTSFYFGDLNTNQRLTRPGYALGAIARHNINNRVTLRTTLYFGNVGASDADSDNNFEKNRNLSFSSNIYDLTNVIEFNFFPFEHGHPGHSMTPYFFGGFNVFRFNPTAELNGQTYSLRELGTEGQSQGKEYNLVNAGLVLGGGFKISINRNVSINIDVSTRFLFTDYLDDVSTVYPEKSLLEASRGPEAVALSDRSLVPGLGDSGRQRGDTKGKDSYTFAGITFMRHFGSIACPDISRIRP
jgi:hypothetical protein